MHRFERSHSTIPETGSTVWSDLNSPKSAEPILTQQADKFNKISAKMRDAAHPLMKQLFILDNRAAGIKKVEVNEFNLPSDKPIIFASNHTNRHDFPVVNEALGVHLYPFAANDGQTRFTRFINKTINGVSAWVERDDKESYRQGEDLAVCYLQNGKYVWVCPESVWNPYRQPAVLPYYRGAARIARKANAYIMPTMLEYTEDTCYVHVGEPLDPNQYPDVDEANIELYNTSLAIKNMLITKSGVDEERWKTLRTKLLKEWPHINPEEQYKYILKLPGYGLPEELLNMRVNK